MKINKDNIIKADGNFYKVISEGKKYFTGINIETNISRFFSVEKLREKDIIRDEKQIEEICTKIEEEKLRKHNEKAEADKQIDIKVFKKKDKKEKLAELDKKTDFTFIEKATLCNSIIVDKIKNEEAEKTYQTNLTLAGMGDWCVQDDEELFYLLAKKVSQAKYGNKKLDDKEFVIGKSTSDVRISEKDWKILEDIINSGYDKIECIEKVQEELGITFEYQSFERIIN
jgi:hypothetical protein